MFEEEMKYSALSVAASAATKVGRMTHNYYRYPARFGDTFVREAIEQFSKPNDVVLDPFCGGGTTLVEALSSGRSAAGSDLSPLALFVTRTKTTLLSERQLALVENWARRVSQSTRDLLHHSTEAEDPRLDGLPPLYRNLLGTLKSLAGDLPRGPTREFAKCLLLRTAQWAFDGKEHTPSPSEIVARILPSFEEMQAGMREFRESLQRAGIDKKELVKSKFLTHGRAKDITPERLGLKRPVSLVVTSPPYLGVHVLYNKWQLKGRRELRTAFYLADCHDIGGPSAYTIVARHARAHQPYYDEIRASFASVERILERNAYVIQLVSFANSEVALPHYLSAMSAAGLRLCETYVRSANGLQWREVPGRRWYARVGAISDSSASKEVLLVHRKGGM